MKTKWKTNLLPLLLVVGGIVIVLMSSKASHDEYLKNKEWAEGVTERVINRSKAFEKSLDSLFNYYEEYRDSMFNAHNLLLDSLTNTVKSKPKT